MWRFRALVLIGFFFILAASPSHAIRCFQGTTGHPHKAPTLVDCDEVETHCTYVEQNLNGKVVRDRFGCGPRPDSFRAFCEDISVNGPKKCFCNDADGCNHPLDTTSGGNWKLSSVFLILVNLIIYFFFMW